MSKELWFAEMERLMANGASYESACDRAHISMMDRLADQADNMRKRAREEGAPSRPTRDPNDADTTDPATSLASQSQNTRKPR